MWHWDITCNLQKKGPRTDGRNTGSEQNLYGHFITGWFLVVRILWLNDMKKKTFSNFLRFFVVGGFISICLYAHSLAITYYGLARWVFEQMSLLSFVSHSKSMLTLIYCILPSHNRTQHKQHTWTQPITCNNKWQIVFTPDFST